MLMETIQRHPEHVLYQSYLGMLPHWQHSFTHYCVRVSRKEREREREGTMNEYKKTA